MGSSILIVDDDEESTSVLKLILEAKGYEAETAFTASEAYAKADKKRYDLILLDYLLGDAKGDEAAAKLKGIRQGVKIILLSGLFADETEGLYDAILQKPVRPDVLLKAISDCLTPPTFST